MFKIDYLGIIATASSLAKDFIIETLPFLAPLFLLGLLLGAIKLMVEEILTTKIGAVISLALIALFLINQGVL